MQQSPFDLMLQQAKSQYGSDLLKDLSSPALGFQFAERLIFGLISANAPKRRGTPKPRQRLASAMTSIFGKPLKERADTRDDDGALLFMAQWYEIDRLTEAKPRSLRQLALAAVRFAGNGNSDDAIADRLRNKFRRRKSKLFSQLDERSTMIEVLQREALYEFEERFAQLGITFHPEK